MFSHEHASHAKIWHQRAGTERHIAALVAREFELRDPPWGAPIVAILHST